MPITETHVVSGQISTSVSGNSVNTSISGNSVVTSISGNVVNISGAQVQTSVSGDTVLAAIGSTFIAGTVIVSSASGGVQFPSNSINVGISLPQQAELSGGGTTNNILVGGLGSNAPYSDTTTFPPYNGVFINVIPSNQFIAVNNTNQIRAVAGTGMSGAALRFFAW